VGGISVLEKSLKKQRKKPMGNKKDQNSHKYFKNKTQVMPTCFEVNLERVSVNQIRNGLFNLILMLIYFAKAKYMHESL